jgi:hypothetical protein
MNGLETSPYVEGKEVTRFELSLSLGELDEEIIGRLDYDDRIFSAQTTAQMVEDYIDLLQRMTADPEKNVATESAATASMAANLES